MLVKWLAVLGGETVAKDTGVTLTGARFVSRSFCRSVGKLAGMMGNWVVREWLIGFEQWMCVRGRGALSRCVQYCKVRRDVGSGLGHSCAISCLRKLYGNATPGEKFILGLWWENLFLMQ